MAKKRITLGRDLSALLGANRKKVSKKVLKKVLKKKQSSKKNDNAGLDIIEFSIEDLQPGKYQPRVKVASDQLSELAESISQQGILQPIIVRKIRKGAYEILAGERRWRAAKLAGLATVPVVVRDIDDKNALAIGLIENIQREDLNAIETAGALQKLVNEFQLTHGQAAEILGKQRATVTNLLRLLSLDDNVQEFLHNGQLEMGHARALLAVPLERQAEIAGKIIANGHTVRMAENMIKNLMTSKSSNTDKPTPVLTEELDDLQQQLTKLMHARVDIAPRARGRGKLTVFYEHPAQLREWAIKLASNIAESEEELL